MTQTDTIYNILIDGQPHRTDEIVRRVYRQLGPSLARVGARIYDIKKKYTVEIEGWRDPQRPTLYWYMMKLNTKFKYEQKNEKTRKTQTRKKTVLKGTHAKTRKTGSTKTIRRKNKRGNK